MGHDSSGDTQATCGGRRDAWIVGARTQVAPRQPGRVRRRRRTGTVTTPRETGRKEKQEGPKEQEGGERSTKGKIWKKKAQLNDKATFSTSAQKQNKKLTLANRLTHQLKKTFLSTILLRMLNNNL